MSGRLIRLEAIVKSEAAIGAMGLHHGGCRRRPKTAALAALRLLSHVIDTLEPRL
jgi:hypothetical protein